MAVCGYDPRADGTYDTPPIAPEMWQAYHIAGEYAVIAITAALNFRELTGEGDLIDLSIHEAVSTCTEVAMPTYIYNGAIVHRQTGRHAAESRTRPWLRRTKDGRYVKAFLFWGGRDFRVITEMLNEAGVEHDLESEEYRELRKTSPSQAQAHFSDVDRPAGGVDDGGGSFSSRAGQGLAVGERSISRRKYRRSAFPGARHLPADQSSRTRPRSQLPGLGRHRRQGSRDRVHARCAASG